MLILFIVGLIVFITKLCLISIKASWSIIKGILFIAVLPLFIVFLLVCNLLYLAIPLLVISIIVSFVFPFFKKI